MLALVLALNALFGLMLAGVVLRADWQRRANRLLALASTLDAAVTGSLALAVAAGMDVTSPLVVHLCNVGRILIVHPTLEFVYAFPLDRRPSKTLRAAGGAAMLLALFLSLYPPTQIWFATWSGLLFFAPYFVMTGAALVRNVSVSRGSSDAAGSLAILGALGFRWSAELVTYVVVRPLFPGSFPAAFTFDATAAPLVGYLVIAYAVLRYRFFRVRGLIAEAGLYGSMALSVLAVTAVGVELIVDHFQERLALLIALTGVSLVPVGAFVALRHYTPLIQDALLARFDPRRAMRKATLESVLRETSELVDPEAVARTTCAALAALSGGNVAFLRSAATATADESLAPELSDYLEAVDHALLHPADVRSAPPSAAAALRNLGADLLVPARFEARLMGALVVRGGTIDQDTTTAACALAPHLASKLAHHALYHRSFELERKLDDASRLAALGTFAAAIAHDIRTPLTSVQLNVQMLQASPALPDGDRESVEIALEELQRMARYVSEILDYSKPVQLQRVEIELQELLERVARAVERTLAARNLHLVWNPPSVALPLVLVDLGRMQQIIENLVENAANASAVGGEIRLEAHVGSADRVAIQVIDHGRGIAAADMEHIFEPFFTRRVDGTGLGLAIVKKLVTAHAGEVSVQSQPGQGTTFVITLPTVRHHSAAVGTIAESTSASEAV